MLERLSTSHDGTHKSRQKHDRFHVFGGKKQVSFQVHIAELRAEVMGCKQLAPGQPCVLQWVRGDTVHVTEDSVGRTVLSWSDTYFAQVITLQFSASGFKPKECKFKVQQKGKTVAKTASVDLSKYCSDQGLAREQTVSLPLQPGGTLYFVISTTGALEQPQRQDSLQPSASRVVERVSSNLHLHGAAAAGQGAATDLARMSGAVASAPAAIARYGTTGGGTDGRPSRGAADVRMSRGASMGGAVGGAAAAGSGYGGAEPTLTPSSSSRNPAAAAGVAGAAVAAGLEAHGRRRDSGGQAAVEVERKTLSSFFLGGGGDGGRKPRHSTSGVELDPAGFAAAAATAAHGIFRRKARAGSKQTAGGAAGVAASTGCSPRHTQHECLSLPFRKSESAHMSLPAAEAAGGGVTWDPPQCERSLSQNILGSVVAAPYSAPPPRAIRSFSCTPGALPSSMTPPVDASRNLARASAGASNSSRSDTGVTGAAAKAAAASAAGAAAGAFAAGAAEGGAGGGGGGGWGSWLRGGLGWGRSSNHSVTATSTTGVLSQASLAGAAGGPGDGGGGGGEHESSKLEAAIISATEAGELREFALDLLRERDEWRRRAVTAQDALNRAQMSRGAAVREAQRLEVRLKQYQDELGRRTDGSLIQELVEAKVSIAELANENMKLRRQITHMGPLFYDDSGDDAPGPEV